MSFDVNLLVTWSAVKTAAGPGLNRYLLLYVCSFLSLPAACAGTDCPYLGAELCGRAVDFCRHVCVYVETHLTSMKFIIALLVQEVKRYVVTYLIGLCNLLILKDKNDQFMVFLTLISLPFAAYFRPMASTLSRLPRARIPRRKM
jgi:hypothetical protein